MKTNKINRPPFVFNYIFSWYYCFYFFAVTSKQFPVVVSSTGQTMKHKQRCFFLLSDYY